MPGQPDTRYDISPAEAIELISRAARPMPTETVALSEAWRRVLARDLTSHVDRPPAHDSALDGFAVHAADTVAASAPDPVSLELIGESWPGRPFHGAMARGEAVRISTGALVPNGADAIIGIEHASADGTRVLVSDRADPGAVRPRGQDLLSGDTYLESGTRLNAVGVALAAAMGHGDMLVARRPRVLVITTGDELRPPGTSLASGQLYESNGVGMAAVLRAAGADIHSVIHAADDHTLLAASVGRSAAAGAIDLIVSSGAVSRGERDVVRDLLFSRGTVSFWRVQVRPAGPTMFGEYEGMPWLGLPGNPVSSLVGCILFALPYLLSATGDTASVPYLNRQLAEVDSRFAAGGKEVLHRARLYRSHATARVAAFENQSSGVLRSLVESEALVVTPPHTTHERGALAEVIELAPYLS